MSWRNILKKSFIFDPDEPNVGGFDVYDQNVELNLSALGEISRDNQKDRVILTLAHEYAHLGAGEEIRDGIIKHINAIFQEYARSGPNVDNGTGANWNPNTNQNLKKLLQNFAGFMYGVELHALRSEQTTANRNWLTTNRYDGGPPDVVNILPWIEELILEGFHFTGGKYEWPLEQEAISVIREHLVNLAEKYES
tara:strand:- start:475 stop:1059 length:585 start_codon:yes stop_codon:yes gene_type:complete